MVYEIQFSEKAKDFFDKLEQKEKEQIFNRLRRIQVQPEKFLIKIINSEFYKLRIGNFRLYIDFRKGELLILVLEIGKRKNVYKK